MATPVTAPPATILRARCERDGAAAGCAVLDWAGSGAMALTGPAGGPPSAPPAPVVARVAAQARRLAELTGRWGTAVEVGVAGLLTARAAETERERGGRVSVNGSSRLLRGRDGWCAVTLARPEDREMAAVVVGAPVEPGDAWPVLSAWVADRPVARVVAALQELSVPAAVLGGVRGPAVRAAAHGRRGPARRTGAPLVVDLSALWAGPLAARLLGRAGARVVKIEDVHRPDGARRGPARFYRDLHAGTETVRLDFRSPDGRQELRNIVRSADIVVEASRPRALRRLGLIAEDLVAERPGRTWVSITGYGRAAFGGHRVAFGDDAAVAAGLVAYDAAGEPVFCADAIADPLTGLRAAAAVVASQLAGGGHLLDVSMAGVSAWLARPARGPVVAHPTLAAPDGRWTVGHGWADRRTVAEPRAGRPW